MQEAFGVVIFAVAIVGAIVAVGTLFGRGRVYEEIGKGGLDLTTPVPEDSSAVATDEIRQMIQAANHRRERRGEAPLDVDDELARLSAPAADPALEAEIRALVIARNHRRARKGQEPLDVDAEVARQLSELSG